MEKEEIKLIELYARLTNTLDRFVYLREDEKGRYIEYAFIDGAPHDNRCLSWYDKLQPKALKRNDHNIDDWKKLCLHEVDEIYELGLFSCGKQNEEGEAKCDAGHPCEKCRDLHASDWTYEEPVKCACWTCYKINIENVRNEKQMKMYQKAVNLAEQFLSSNLISTFTDKGTFTATNKPMSQTEFIENFKDFMLCVGKNKTK